MKVEKIDHIHIAVKGLEKAIKFFSDILGAKFSQTIFAEKFDLKSVLAPPGIGAYPVNFTRRSDSKIHRMLW